MKWNHTENTILRGSPGELHGDTVWKEMPGSLSWVGGEGGADMGVERVSDNSRFQNPKFYRCGVFSDIRKPQQICLTLHNCVFLSL